METVTKRGQIWFSHPLSADLESELYNDTGCNIHSYLVESVCKKIFTKFIIFDDKKIIIYKVFL